MFRFCSAKPVIFKPPISDKHGWIDPKHGNLIPYLGHFNVLIWFENWLSKTVEVRDVLSVRLHSNLEQSSFGK
jgi:hypothetical protein